MPSHLIFFRRHSSHALVTLRRFCCGMVDVSPAADWVPEGSSDPDWPGPRFDDLTLSDGEASSCGDKSADSSSDMSGEFPEATVLLRTVSLLLEPPPERCEPWVGCEGGRVGREADSARGPFMFPANPLVGRVARYARQPALVAGWISGGRSQQTLGRIAHVLRKAGAITKPSIRSIYQRRE